MQSESTYRSLRSSLLPFAQNLREAQNMEGSEEQVEKEDETLDPYSLMRRFHDPSFHVPARVKPLKVRFFASIDRYFNKNASGQQSVPGIVQRESLVLLFWNFLVMLSIIYNIYEIPIAIFFIRDVYQAEFNNLPTLVINYLILAVLFVNMMLVIPNTSFYSYGYLVTQREHIFKRYLKFQFWLDLGAWLVLLIYIVSGVPELIFLKLVFYVSFYNMYTTDQMIIEKLELLRLRYALYRIIRLLSLFVEVVLWLSCIFFAIDYSFYQKGEYYPDYLWLTNSICTTPIQIISEPWYVWLDYAVYWTLQTISMVGYGDMTPRNPPEAAYCNIVVLVMTIFYAFYISSVWDIIGEANELRDTESKHWRLLKRYYHQKCLHNRDSDEVETIKNRMGSYLFEMWEKENGQIGEEDNIETILNDALSPELKDEFFMTYRVEYFAKVPLFAILAQAPNYYEIIRSTIADIRECRYGHNELIYEDSHLDSDPKMLFLLQGNVELFYRNSGYTLELEQNPLKQGKSQHLSFGIHSFVTSLTRDHCAQTLSFCKVSELSRKNFLTNLNKDPILYERFNEIYQQVLLGEAEAAMVGEHCWECESLSHNIWGCHQCAFNVRNSIMAKQSWWSLRQEDKKPLGRHYRMYFSRLSVKSQKTRGSVYRPRRNINIDKVKNYKNYYRNSNLK